MPKDRRVAIVLALLLGTAALRAQTSQNVLLIVGDDLDPQMVGCYGSSLAAPTPNIDALAQRGVRFTRAYMNPACSPTRGALLTGRYGFRNGVTSTLGPTELGCDPAETTLPMALQGTVATALIGKWHMGIRYGTMSPNNYGWAHFAGVIDAAIPDYYHWTKVVDGQPVPVDNYATVEMVDDALAWIDAQTGPWHLELSFTAPHTPLHAPPPDLHTRQLNGLSTSTSPYAFCQAMVEAMDTEIGRLLAALPAATLADTNVIVIGDNGMDPAVTVPPIDPTRVKGSLYQRGSHVPMIVTGPAVVSPGRTCAALVSAVDLFPTILELCGAPLPPSVGERPLDGTSIVPLLQDTAPSIRDHVYLEMSTSYSGGGYAVCDDDYELLRIQNNIPQHLELYDFAADPMETGELLAAPLAPVAAAEFTRFQAILDDLRPDGWVEGFGSGCPGGAGPMRMRAQTMPTVGTNFFFHLDNMSPTALLPLAVLGFSNTLSNGVPLPFSLEPYGMPGCNLIVSSDGFPGVAPGNGYGVVRIPNYPVYDAAVFHLQGFVLEPGVNAAGIAATNGLRCNVGM